MKPTLHLGEDSTESHADGRVSSRQKAHVCEDIEVRAMFHEWDLAPAYALLGTVNKKPVEFKNCIALPETLLLTGIEPVKIGRTLSLGHDEVFKLDFSLCLTRGVCEDGEHRFVGWNRFWRPETGRYERLRLSGFKAEIGSHGKASFVATFGQQEIQYGRNVYDYADDRGGFEFLWTLKGTK